MKNMKNLFAVCGSMVACCGLLGQSQAWSEEDSLISRSFLESFYIDSATQQLEDEVYLTLENLYAEKLSEIHHLSRELSMIEQEKQVATGMYVEEFHYGDEIQLKEGCVIAPLVGIMYLRLEGTVVNLSTGKAVSEGILNLGEQYIVAEDSTATVLVESSSGGQASLLGRITVNQVEIKEDNTFFDVDDYDWFYDAVNYVADNAIFTGTSDQYFSPYFTMDRGMMMTVLYRIAGSPQEELNSATAEFVDVVGDEWFAPYVAWGATQQITAGIGGGYFAPNETVTRQQVLVMLYAFSKDYLKLDVSGSADLSNYPDAESVAVWAIPGVSWAVSQNLLQGIPSNTERLLADVVASRAEVATILMNFSESFFKS